MRVHISAHRRRAAASLDAVPVPDPEAQRRRRATRRQTTLNTLVPAE